MQKGISSCNYKYVGFRYARAAVGVGDRMTQQGNLHVKTKRVPTTMLTWLGDPGSERTSRRQSKK